MTAYNAILTRDPLPIPEEDVRRVYGALAAVCGRSGRGVTDLRWVGKSLGLRPISLRLALAEARVRGWIHVEHDPANFERVTVYLPLSELLP